MLNLIVKARKRIVALQNLNDALPSLNHEAQKFDSDVLSLNAEARKRIVEAQSLKLNVIPQLNFFVESSQAAK